MPTLSLERGDLIVRLKGWDRFFALRKEVRVPLDRITNARVQTDVASLVRGLKLPGGYWPGKVYAGSWWSPEGWDFWSVSDPRRALVIDLHGDRFQRWIINTDDPDAWARTLNQRIGRHPGAVNAD